MTTYLIFNNKLKYKIYLLIFLLKEIIIIFSILSLGGSMVKAFD